MENKEKKAWDTKGVISAILAIPAYFVAALVFVLYMIKLRAFNTVTAPQVVLFALGMNLIPIIQIILAAVSLKTNPTAHKWPAIVAIVLGSIGIVFWSLIIVSAY